MLMELEIIFISLTATLTLAPLHTHYLEKMGVKRILKLGGEKAPWLPLAIGKAVLNPSSPGWYKMLSS